MAMVISQGVRKESLRQLSSIAISMPLLVFRTLEKEKMTHIELEDVGI
jgi:hypothetical protein